MNALISVAAACRGKTCRAVRGGLLPYRLPRSSPWLLKGGNRHDELYELYGMSCKPVHEALRRSLPENFKVQNHRAGSGLPERLRFGYSSVTICREAIGSPVMCWMRPFLRYTLDKESPREQAKPSRLSLGRGLCVAWRFQASDVE